MLLESITRNATALTTTASLPLDAIKPALLGRVDFEQTLINKAPRVINDDVVRAHSPSTVTQGWC